MANMREIRTRINSVQDTMKITNAMYLIASSKLRKARNGRDAVAPYFESLQSTISDILERSPELEQGLFENESMRAKEDNEKHRAFIVITSDKGLAGAYNHNIVKLVESELAKPSDGDTLIFVGHMARNYIKKSEKVNIDEDHIYPATQPTSFRAREIAEYVMDKFMDDEFDEVYIVYTKMINSLAFEPVLIRTLPLTRLMFEDVPSDEIRLQRPVFLPSPGQVLGHIVPNYVKGLIYGAMAESYACEQSARMTAMDNATTNAKDMIRELSLVYNRVRQAAITQEITEIVSGAQSSH